jgi:hypothetical protein
VAPDDLRLNSLDGFSKASPRFLLEEHSHCEVPAGCGGIVLRWINPAAGLPVLLHFFHPTPATLAIDGAPTTTSHVLLAPGPHVLSLEFPAPPIDGHALLVLVGRLKMAVFNHSDELLVLRSADDRSWLFSTSTPSAGWMTDPDLPGRGWRPLTRRPVSAADVSDSYVFDRATAAGGEPLGIPPSRRRLPIRVRKVFTVPPVTRR